MTDEPLVVERPLDITLVGDEWEELVSTGIELAQNLDKGRFALGDVGMRCATVYGENSLGTLASDIGLARAHTFRPVLKQFVPTHTINLTEIAEGKSA